MSAPSCALAASAHSSQVLFDKIALGRLQISNRLAVAPMTRVSATADGRATERMVRYYRDFAEGGFGLVVSEGIYTDRKFSQGYLHQPGLADRAHTTAWRQVTQAVHAAGGRMIAQLMHAGALSQGNPHAETTVGPSALKPKGVQMRFYRGDGPYRLPDEISADQIREAIEGFAEAAQRAGEAGFDGVEIHGANGYILDQFLSEGTNQRHDRYGGSVQARLTLTLEVIAAIRAPIGRDFPVGLRISQAKVNDPDYKWRAGEEDAEAIFTSLGQADLDYIHTTEPEAWGGAFAMDGPSLAALAKRFSRLPVMANGGIRDGGQAARQIADGEADIVSLGRAALGDPAWPRRVGEGLSPVRFNPASLRPLADLASTDAFRERTP